MKFLIKEGRGWLTREPLTKIILGTIHAAKCGSWKLLRSEDRLSVPLSKQCYLMMYVSFPQNPRGSKGFRDLESLAYFETEYSSLVRSFNPRRKSLFLCTHDNGFR